MQSLPFFQNVKQSDNYVQVFSARTNDDYRKDQEIDTPIIPDLSQDPLIRLALEQRRADIVAKLHFQPLDLDRRRLRLVRKAENTIVLHKIEVIAL